MTNPSTVPQWSATIAVPQKPPTSVMYKTKRLVILFLVASIVQFILGIGMIFTVVYYTLYSGVPFWGLVSYLVAAGLTLSAQNTTSPCVVKGSLALNILSAIISALGIVMVCLDIVVVYVGCPLVVGDHYFCQGRSTGAFVVYALLLITDLTLFCVSISIAVYGCRSLDTTTSAPQGNQALHFSAQIAQSKGIFLNPLSYQGHRTCLSRVIAFIKVSQGLEQSRKRILQSLWGRHLLQRILGDLLSADILIYSCPAMRPSVQVTDPLHKYFNKISIDSRNTYRLIRMGVPPTGDLDHQHSGPYVNQ
ncbi:uncharacterized protein LOC142219234 [Leptodactylus fuscus]|uniref:uncharacterized protein LOC142219234 n=1 Tax=Leptodactylus fuscus TaxID=238119 RepID=UPI003F4EC648